jgi:hypothetical protein
MLTNPLSEANKALSSLANPNGGVLAETQLILALRLTMQGTVVLEFNKGFDMV